jgi:hypothetical protein
LQYITSSDGHIYNLARYEPEMCWSRKPEDLAKDSNAYVSMGIYPALSIVEMTDIWSSPSNKYWHNQGPRYASMQQGNTRGSLMVPYKEVSYAAMVNGYNPDRSGYGV